MANKELIKAYADTEYPIVGDYNTKKYGNDRMNEYVQKTLADVVKLSNGMLCGFEKQSIETKFCFHDEGPEYDFYKELRSDDNRLKNYFFSRNLHRLDEFIEVYEYKEDNKMPCVYDYKNGLCKPQWIWNNEKEDGYVPLNEEDTKIVLDVLYKMRADFIKRLENWWKRYGAEKLHMWTYWADA